MKIPLDKIRIGTKVRIIESPTKAFPIGSIQEFTAIPEHYSSDYPDLPCFKNNWCGVKYELIHKRTIII